MTQLNLKPQKNVFLISYTQADGETLVSLLRELKDERGYEVEAALCMGDIYSAGFEP